MSGGPVELRVRVFAAHSAIVGAPYTTVLVPSLATVGSVRSALAERAAEHGWPAAMARAPIAVNLEYVGDQHPVAPGDEIALIPPVAGG